MKNRNLKNKRDPKTPRDVDFILDHYFKTRIVPCISFEVSLDIVKTFILDFFPIKVEFS